MSKLQVAVIWGYPREEMPWTSHHMFWEQTLKDRPDTEVSRYTWENWTYMPVGLDLYLFLDFHPSLFKVQYTNYHPRVFYWWDAFHHSFVYPAQIIECFDRSYFPELHVVRALQANGVQKVKWLPAAYYPGLYKPIEANKLHSFAFIGQPDDVVIRKGHTRKAFIERLAYEEGIRAYVGQGFYGEQLNRIYNESLILLDRTIYCNLGTRFFETIGSGGFLLVNRGSIVNGMDELAVEGQHFISYDDSYDDCLSKLRYYILHDSERAKIAKQGEEYFRNHHTYSHRLKVILEDLGYV